MNEWIRSFTKGTKVDLYSRFLAVKSIHYGIDLLTAALILTGQLQPVGMFVVPEGFMLSFSGPIIGATEITTTTTGAAFVMDGLEVITAVLLIAQVFGTTGIYVTSHRFSIVVAGPPFGSKPSVANLPGVPASILNQYETMTMKHFGLIKTGGKIKKSGRPPIPKSKRTRKRKRGRGVT
ncbi:hypothetical protein [Sulfoacidibacillus ferrooxidans]|uniref:Uncharacterized protein n=1 Tax=Sulfoacidibacillus ferrooxidans TaxID=2005001 RepID=A0A9X1V6T4_9BACL|nr:hypothetical protein [Sulfoacidibacillus ferrooxidans]MCI0181835.1 hypothetical protein [Sulfoacidibacillus ferrooxidans]